MTLIEITALLAAMTALALVPSTSVALVVARSSTAGFLNGAAVTAGIVAGDLVFVCLAVLGMAALAEIMGGLFLAIRYLAGAYLIWFGISLLRSAPSAQMSVTGRSASTLSASFILGLLLTLGDVKAIVFYASLFPAFVDMASLTTADIAMIVAITVVTVGGVKLGYAYGACRISALAGHLRGQRAAKFAAGGCMIGAGVYLVAKP